MVDKPRQAQSTEELVIAHQAGLWRYLRLLGSSESQIEDHIQETFLALLRSPMENRGHPAAAQYLRTIARNIFLKSLRRTRLEEATLAANEADQTWRRYVDDEHEDAHLSALRNCLEALPERSRQIMQLRFRDGMARRDIAAQMAMKDSGLKTLIQRVRKALRDCVIEKLGNKLEERRKS